MGVDANHANQPANQEEGWKLFLGQTREAQRSIYPQAIRFLNIDTLLFYKCMLIIIASSLQLESAFHIIVHFDICI